jgi:hypothetical protein
MKSKLDKIAKEIDKCLPLSAAVVDSFAEDRAGVYLICRDKQIIYVGRSDISVRRRLLNHCGRFEGCTFMAEYCKKGLGLDRLEYILIENLKIRFKLENKVNASIRV